MLISIASDHAGFNLKSYLITRLGKLSSDFNILDLGCDSSESCDYPDYAKKVVKTIADNRVEFGILICGSGVGMSIAANRHENIRAALVATPKAAKLARQHNNANIIVFGEKFISKEDAYDCCLIFFNTAFQNGRHSRRLLKLTPDKQI